MRRQKIAAERKIALLGALVALLLALGYAAYRRLYRPGPPRLGLQPSPGVRIFREIFRKMRAHFAKIPRPTLALAIARASLKIQWRTTLPTLALAIARASLKIQWCTTTTYARTRYRSRIAKNTGASGSTSLGGTAG